MNTEPLFDSPRLTGHMPNRRTCFELDGRHWCLLHDPDWPDTTDEDE